VKNKKQSLTNKIICEIYDAFKHLKADSNLLSVIGSWRDTLEDKEILSLLKEYNKR
jgi:hypothetical protein